MKTVTLSDHTEYMANEHERLFQQEWEAYEAALAEQNQRKQYLWQCLEDSWKRRCFLEAIRTIFALIRERGQVPRPPAMRLATERERVWQSGHDAEHWVAFQLGQSLDDEWTLICGYRSFRGEIDQILVGPCGVCALEIKHLNGTVYINGDQWWRDKYDRYGNLVESGLPIEDRGGRSPSVQLNQSVVQLQNVLQHCGRAARPRRVVILTHERSILGESVNQTVDLVLTASDAKTRDLFCEWTALFSSQEVERIVELIKQDHARYENRRHGRGNRGRSRRRKAHVPNRSTHLRA